MFPWKRSLVFPILLFSSISLHWSLRKAFLSLRAILCNSAFSWVYRSLSLLPFTFLLFSLFVRPPQTITLPFCISFPWGWFLSLPPKQCYEPLSIVLQAFCRLPDLIPWINSSVHCIIIRIWFRSYLNSLVICPTFFNLRPNFAIKSS